MMNREISSLIHDTMKGLYDKKMQEKKKKDDI